MSNPGEPTEGTQPPTRDALEARVRELEKENTRLRSELSESQAAPARDRAILNGLILDDLPQNEAEFASRAANSASFSELLRELEREFGLEAPP